jgi:hypothetical protein
MKKLTSIISLKKIASVAFLLIILFNNQILAQLDPLPGDPLPGDPGIEVPLDVPIVLAILGVGGFLVVFFLNKKKTAQHHNKPE